MNDTLNSPGSLVASKRDGTVFTPIMESLLGFTGVTGSPWEVYHSSTLYPNLDGSEDAPTTKYRRDGLKKDMSNEMWGKYIYI